MAPEPQPSRRGVFVTGTDTGVGKTWTVLGLLTALRQRGQRVHGMKPVATGCRPTEQGLRSDDALMIQDHAGEDLPYEWVNPYAFEPPIAPAFAARQAGVRISIPRIRTVERRLARAAELTVIEGIGGWRVPLGPRSRVSDLAARLGYPVVLVVGLRLGCINHALLSAEAIERDGVVLAGWVAIQIDRDYRTLRDTLDTVKAGIPSPQLGFIPWMSRLYPEALASHLEAGLRYIV
ncbi:MAG: dethiobiotin synthase [Pseudomonadota bacterium]|nr:dethiobiotin synthase [Pseudomonadota bacterium]